MKTVYSLTLCASTLLAGVVLAQSHPTAPENETSSRERSLHSS